MQLIEKFKNIYFNSFNENSEKIHARNLIKYQMHVNKLHILEIEFTSSLVNKLDNLEHVELILDMTTKTCSFPKPTVSNSRLTMHIG